MNINKFLCCSKIDQLNSASYQLEIVAWTVLTALDMDADDLEWVKESCSDEL